MATMPNGQQIVGKNMGTTTGGTTAAAPQMKSIYSTGQNGKTYSPYSIAADAPLYSYTVPKHNFKTWGLKDTAGDEWYLTTGGQWRNVKSNVLSKTHPGYAAAAAPTTETPPDTAPPPVAGPPTWKSVWDFQPNQYKDIFNTTPVAEKSFWDYYKTPGTSAAFQFAQSEGNKELDRKLASMGMLGSGLDVERREQMTRANMADEVGRLMESAATDYGGYLSRMQQDASNQQSAQKLIASLMGSDFGAYQDAVRQDKDIEVTKDGQQLDAVGMALDFIKSLNPMQYAFPAAQGSSELSTQLGKALAAASSMGGGGGGGSSGGGASELPESPGKFDKTGYWLGTASNILSTMLPHLLK